MHVYFAGIGGTGIGPLAMIAKQAGFDISGSDKQDSDYIRNLKKNGVTEISIGQSGLELEALHAKNPIDWVVYSSALPKENPNHPELLKAKQLGIRSSKRDEFLNFLLSEKKLKLIAVAGTHGKTTVTAMTIWLLKSLGIPISYSIGAKLSFGEMGSYDANSKYFVYEADEYDRNFLSFTPDIAIISGIAYDHPDIFPTVEEYNQAFRDFIDSSRAVFAHPDDLETLGLDAKPEAVNISDLSLTGEVNRKNAQLVIEAVASLTNEPLEKLTEITNNFPGVSRRFEKISDSIYSDYAHTPEKILGALQIANEVAGKNVVVIYEGLHNTRQHFIKDKLVSLFYGIKELYVVPSYRAREDENLENLTPRKLVEIIKQPDQRHPAELNEELARAITKHVKNGDLVLCLTAGGGGSLDEWLRKNFQKA